MSSGEIMASFDDRFSSTPLFLDGDRKHHLLNVWRYTVFHRRENRHGDRLPLRCEVYWPHSLDDMRPALDHIVFDKTPSRMLCNLFWQSIDWTWVRRELGPLVVHDTGCGSGWMGQKIPEWLGEQIMYHGFEVVRDRRWPDLTNENLKLHFFDGLNYGSTFACRPNLVITQSAMEHFRQDLSYVDAIAECLESSEKMLQIHMIPGSDTLPYYGPHGWRQYNRDAIRRLVGRFPSGLDIVVVALGAPEVSRLYKKWIASRKTLRKLKKNPEVQAIYKAEWLAAMEACSPVGIDKASFLALIAAKGLSMPVWPRLVTRRCS